MAAEILVNIGSDNGLLSDSTKSLPEPLLTYHHKILWHSFDNNYTSAQDMNLKNKLHLKLLPHIPAVNESRYWHMCSC